MNTANVARMHAAAATAIAIWNPANSSGPPCCKTPPSRAMAKRDPARETALLTPDAVPARSDSTEVRTRVVNGAIARLMPSDSNRMGGRCPPNRSRSNRHVASWRQGDDGAAGEQWQAPAEPAASHAGKRRDDRNQH